MIGSLSPQILFGLVLQASALTSWAAPAEEILVIAVTPDGSREQALSRIPSTVHHVSATELNASLALDLSDYLNRRLPSVTINSAQNNPLQADLHYRGFTASPLLGLPQGLSVYQNGIRINDTLGDAVHWDLLPESAIAQIDLMSGANPVYGLNTLGGALAIRMKDGFSAPRFGLSVEGGSWGRRTASVEGSQHAGDFAGYLNLSHFVEDGWRRFSDTEAVTAFGSLSWRPDAPHTAELSLQKSHSNLIGNGALPVGLAEQSRAAIFTAPDITENDLTMIGLNAGTALGETLNTTATLYWRDHRTDSFNGDGADFGLCSFSDDAPALLEDAESLEETLEDAIGFDLEAACDEEAPQFASLEALNASLASLALAAGVPGSAVEIDDLTRYLRGSGSLMADAVNNISQRQQRARGFHWQLNGIAGAHAFSLGLGIDEGLAHFRSELELSMLDPLTRSTRGLGSGLFDSRADTRVTSQASSRSVFVTDTFAMGDTLDVTLSARFNDTRIRLRDRSGERPELDGNHRFIRLNPALGITWNPADAFTLFAQYSESHRVPTPIELACNEGIFERAQAFALARGEDPEAIEFECRLPNAFLADPPLDAVVTKGGEVGVRARLLSMPLQISLFRASNHSDILFQTTGRATGLFANVDETRREGIEASLSGEWQRWQWFTSVTLMKASFQDHFHVLSPLHPDANDAGEIAVSAGDRIPGIPGKVAKLGVNYAFSEAVHSGLEWMVNGPQVMRGDESNALPEIDGTALVNAHLTWRVRTSLSLSVRVSNLLDTEYENFGMLGEDPSELLPTLDNTRPVYLGIGAPRAAWVALELSL